jgi:hypothetical protein
VIVGHDIARGVDNKTRSQARALASWHPTAEETVKKLLKRITLFTKG